MHAVLVAPLVGVVAAGRGIFIWLILRALVRAVGWPGALAIAAVVAIAMTLVRQQRR